MLPVDGIAGKTSSYCAELFGILGALLLLYQLLDSHKQHWDQLSAVIWCNNEAAVNRFNILEERQHYSIASANHADADVLLELRWWRARIPIRVHALLTSEILCPSPLPAHVILTLLQSRYRPIMQVDISSLPIHNIPSLELQPHTTWALPSPVSSHN